MSHLQGTSSRDAIREKREMYKKVEKLFKRGLLMLKKSVSEQMDFHAVLLLTEITKCRLCSQFIVWTARNSCCEPCFIDWMNEDDPDDEIIKCRNCNTPIKAALSDEDLKKFCEVFQIDFEDKKTSPKRHFSYPILGQVAMDQLFVDFEINRDSADERIQNP